MPLSLLAEEYGDLVHATLDRQRRAEAPAELDGRFVLPLGSPPAGLSEPETALLARLGGRAQAADRLVTSRRETNALRRLVDRRLVIAAGLTPSDAAHVLGLHSAWDAAAALKGAELFARRRGATGRAFAETGRELAQRVVDTLVRCSAEFVLDCALAEDGFEDAGLSRHPLAVAAMADPTGLVRLSLSLSAPLVGLGASAATYYPDIARLVRAPSLVPEHAEVANAVGAVVGGVHASAEVKVLQPVEGVFRVLGAGLARDFGDLAEALALAREAARGEAAAAAIRAGAGAVEVSAAVEVRKAQTEGREIFVEATVSARASGRPRIGAG